MHNNLEKTKGVTSVFIASQEGHHDTVETLIELKANVDTPEMLGNVAVPPIYIAAYQAHRSIVKRLLKIAKLPDDHLGNR